MSSFRLTPEAVERHPDRTKGDVVAVQLFDQKETAEDARREWAGSRRYATKITGRTVRADRVEATLYVLTVRSKTPRVSEAEGSGYMLDPTRCGVVRETIRGRKAYLIVFAVDGGEEKRWVRWATDRYTASDEAAEAIKREWPGATFFEIRSVSETRHTLPHRVSEVSRPYEAATPLLSENPEESGLWRCPSCGNTRDFVGIDEHGYAGPDECDGSCGLSPDDENAVCECECELRQEFVVDGTEVHDYAAHTGGGWGAEIGEYTRIYCGQCDALLWRDTTATEG